MKKLFSILLLCVITQVALSQTITVSEWQSGKKLFQVTNSEARSWVSNELLLAYDDGIFSNARTGEKMYEFKNNVLSDAKTGTKLFEYNHKQVIDAKSGKVMYELNSSDKSISEAESGKKLFGLSKGDILPYRVFFILIAGGQIK